MKLKNLGILPKEKKPKTYGDLIDQHKELEGLAYNKALHDCGEVEIEINEILLNAELCKFFAEQCEKGNLVHKDVEYEKLTQAIAKALPGMLKKK